MLFRMIREIKLSDWFGCVLVIFFTSRRCSRNLVVFLFHQSIIYCNKCKLSSKWHWWRYTWRDQWSLWISWVPIFSLRYEWKNLISLAKTNLFSLWILHLFILSFPMTKVSGHSNTFSINVLTLNCLAFRDLYDKQVNGVAMGTKMGPS